LAVVPFIELAVPDWPVLHIKNAIFLFPFFGFGILLYRKPELLRSNTLAVLSLVTVAPLLATQFIAYGASNVMDSYVIVRWLAALAAIVAFLRFFPRVKVMEWLAIFSFTVYLWHPAASGLIRTIALEAGIANIPLLFAIGLAAGLVLPVMLHRAMQRLPKLSPLFIGR
jgi:peptidoglycan/LPS O-acetylase OafA/YrhL